MFAAPVLIDRSMTNFSAWVGRNGNRIKSKMAARYREKRTSITTVWDQYLSSATFPNPLIFHYPLPLNVTNAVLSKETHNCDSTADQVSDFFQNYLCDFRLWSCYLSPERCGSLGSGCCRASPGGCPDCCTVRCRGTAAAAAVAVVDPGSPGTGCCTCGSIRKLYF